MPTLTWNEEWSDPNYEWPVTSSPDSDTVSRVAKQSGGRVAEEAHADRGVQMKFPNPAVPRTSIRKQERRAECRRRAKIVAGALSGICVVCDAVHLWPRYAEAAG